MSQKILRPPKKTDLPFIYNSWLESYKESPDNPFKSEGAYFSYQKMLLVSILERSLVSVLCNPDDLDQIFGYAVYEIKDNQITLHWLHVKYSFRRFGFARFLIESMFELAESKGVFNKSLLITARGLSYKHVKDKIKHTYDPRKAFAIKEIT